MASPAGFRTRFGRTGMRESVTHQAFPADLDQRHNINVYGGYRVRPSVNLSVRWSYGSGFPIPGYVQRNGSLYSLSASRNQLRVKPFSRIDVRINKAWTYDKWKLTLYGEIINLTNRSNYVFESFDGYNATSRAGLHYAGQAVSDSAFGRSGFRTLAARPQLFHQVVWDSQVPLIAAGQPHPRLHCAVEIASAGHQQAVMAGQSQVEFRLPRAVIAVVCLNGIQPGPHTVPASIEVRPR